MRRRTPFLRAWRAVFPGCTVILLCLALSCSKNSNAPYYSGPTVTAPPTTTTPGSAAVESDASLTLGNPSNAVADLAQRDNYLIEYPQYALSYNASEGRPNWVSWHVDRRDIGEIDRGQFRPDTTLPEGFYRVVPRDYTGTGYDRGHHCPSKDRSRSREDNDATFLMTNIMPQAPGNNQGPWRELEEHTRALVEEGFEAYVVCGGSGSSGTIARGRVSVPAYTWKVIVALPDESGDDLARINERTRVIAVRMPNTDDIREQDWREFRVSVDAIEQETGYDFLSNVPTPVQDALEKRVDRG